MEIQDKNAKNSIKSKNYAKSKTLRKLEKLTLIDWYIVMKPSVPCSRMKSTSEKDVCRLNSKLSSKLSLVGLVLVCYTDCWSFPYTQAVLYFPNNA